MNLYDEHTQTSKKRPPPTEGSFRVLNHLQDKEKIGAKENPYSLTSRLNLLTE